MAGFYCTKACFKTLVTWIIKLHNFTNIWSRSKRVRIFPQGTYEAQNFILRNSIGLYSRTKEFLRYVHCDESNDSLKSSKSIKYQWCIYSYSFVLSCVKLTKTYFSKNICGFDMKRGRWNTLSFWISGEDISKFYIWNFESSESFGRKNNLFNSLGTNKISRIFTFSMYIHVVLLVNSQNNLNYASTLSVREVMKFYNLGGQSYLTDLSFISRISTGSLCLPSTLQTVVSCFFLECEMSLFQNIS